MKSFIFYETIGNKIFSHTIKAKDWKEAEQIASLLNYELKGILHETIII